MPTLSKTARLRLFRTAILASPPAGSLDDALAQITVALNTIEDRFSGVPYNPDLWETDGRMYPPQSDMASPALDFPSATAYRSRAHRTVIAPNGAFVIIDFRRDTLFVEKPGRDGQGLLPESPKIPA